MRIINKWENFNQIKDNIVLNIGNYDGIHIGHQELIREGISLSNGRKFALLTFNPHPKHFFNPIKFHRITTKLEMKEILSKMGVDIWLDLPFNFKIARLSPTEFLDLITKNLKIDHVIVGFNFKFGNKAKGDVIFLRNYLEKKAIGLSVHEPVRYEGEKVSSTLIRDLLLDGNIEKANVLMGRSYTITGMVEKGQGRGKGLGFPTANLNVEKIKLLPKNGVYAGYIEDGFLAAINIGENPTFENKRKTVEVHIIDLKQDKDLYGRELKIYIKKFLRNERKFSNIKELQKQVQKDILTVKQLNNQQLFTIDS
ncbi:MAG: bifunctional riboflavin kinase/FAD synthetase [Clostridia bacterium]